jgi:hypothetical protein
VLRLDDLEQTRVMLLDKIKLRFEGGPQQLIWADFSVHLEDPSAEEVDYFHEMINRDVKLILSQDADLVEEMRAAKQNIAVSTTVSESGDLPLPERDAQQLQQAANELADDNSKKRGRKKAA